MSRKKTITAPQVSHVQLPYKIKGSEADAHLPFLFANHPADHMERSLWCRSGDDTSIMVMVVDDSRIVVDICRVDTTQS